MTADDTAVVRGMIDAWNRRDLDDVLALVDPDVEYVNQPTAMEPGTRRRHEGMVDVTRKQWEALAPDGAMEVERLHERGDAILTEVRLSRSMPGSQAKIDVMCLFSWRIVGGKVRRLEVLGAGSEFKEALEAAGLS